MPGRRALDAYDAYLFDVDGTLVYHDAAIPGAAEALQALKSSGKHVLAVTNNSSLRQHQVAASGDSACRSPMTRSFQHWSPPRSSWRTRNQARESTFSVIPVCARKSRGAGWQ